MENFKAIPAKFLVCLVGRRRGERLVAAAKAVGGRGGTLAFGKGHGSNRVLRALSLADEQQDVVFMVLGREAAQVVAAVKEEAAKAPKKLGGIAVILDVPELFLRHVARDGTDQAPDGAKRSIAMESGYQMISVIVNNGYGDAVMAAARKAGATGGTILNARGTGTEEDVKFFGITLVPEKEMLFIVAEKTKAKAILEAVTGVPKLNEPGGGIVFNMNVEEFITLGK